MGFVRAMTAARVAIYAGRSNVDGLSDLTTAPDLERTIRASNVLAVLDPMSFPWEWFDDAPIRCPVLVDLRECSEDDLVALVPALTALTASDAILGDQSIVAAACETLGLPNIWSSPDLDLAAFASSARRSKLADVEEALITAKLSEDGNVVIRVIGGDQLRSARTGFAALVHEMSKDLDGAPVDTVWGIHPEPGTPVERAVVAFRPRRKP